MLIMGPMKFNDECVGVLAIQKKIGFKMHWEYHMQRQKLVSACEILRRVGPLMGWKTWLIRAMVREEFQNMRNLRVNEQAPKFHKPNTKNVDFFFYFLI